MKLTFRIVLAVLAGGLVFWLWTTLFPSPEKLVLKRIAQLAASANISATDSNLVRAGKAASLADDFAGDAVIDLSSSEIGVHSLAGRDEIRETALGGFTWLPSLKVQFMDAVAHVEADHRSALVTCTARVSAGDSRDFGIQEMQFELKKIDGAWLVTRAEAVKTLQ